MPLGVETYKVTMINKCKDGQLYEEHTWWNQTTPGRLKGLQNMISRVNTKRLDNRRNLGVGPKVEVICSPFSVEVFLYNIRFKPKFS